MVLGYIYLISGNFRDDLFFAFSRPLLNPQILENAKIISCVVFYKKNDCRKLKVLQILANFVTREKTGNAVHAWRKVGFCLTRKKNNNKKPHISKIHELIRCEYL